MKKGIFAMFILVASVAMVACTNANATNEGAAGEKDAFKVLEKEESIIGNKIRKKLKWKLKCKHQQWAKKCQ